MDPQLADYLALRRPAKRDVVVSPIMFWTVTGLTTLVLAFTGLLALVLFTYSTTTAAYPPLGEHLALRATGITTVYDRHGEPLGLLTNPNSSIAAPVPLERISSHLITATISTEDNNYWEHGGFDLGGLARAAWSNYAGDSTTGGSTITQQLVKSAYFTTDCIESAGVRQCYAPRTVSRKLKEIALAVETDSRYSKEQILAWYLNSISYSGRYVGAEAAAAGYFRKSAADLTLAESALLAGIPSAPTLYNPRTNCEKDPATGVCTVDAEGRTILGGEAKARQEYVLDLMVEHGHLSFDEAAEAIAQVVLVYPPTTGLKASAFVDNQVEPRLLRMCRAGLLPEPRENETCEESVHTAGYRVTTTLDWEMNTEASLLLNKYVSAGLAAGCDCHNGSIVTIEPASGQILVYVPNLDPTWVSDVRVAGAIDQAADIHQPGSSFKPAVYLSWMDTLNKTPMSAIWDTNPMPLIDKPKKPEDQVTITNPGRGGTASGLISARAALGGSQNVPAFRAATEAGVENVIAMAKALGITTLDQNFDPTFRDHDAIIYGPSIATGGANIRAVDLAYMNATIANMGVMVGVPTHATTLPTKDALSTDAAEGDDLVRARNQRDAFLRGHLRLPGTRELDPVVVLRVETSDGVVVYEHGDDLVRKPTVNPGSVWMLHSIMSDCTARFLIWTCGSSNDDLLLDVFVGGVKIPGGVKTGTQQTPTSAKDTLETWLTGYSRYAATAVWIGNSDKSPVRDGPEANYASANTTLRLYKNWMGAYHARMKALGLFDVPAGFEELQPENVRQGPFQSATTERGHGGGCYGRVTTWQRTDVDYLGGDCKGKSCFELPAFKRDLAVTLAYSRGIPACGANVAPRNPSPESSTTPDPAATAGATVSQTPPPKKPETPTPVPPTKPATSPVASPTSVPPASPRASTTPGSN